MVWRKTQVIMTHFAKKSCEAVYNRFNKGKEFQAWYYKEIVESLKSLSGMPMYEELCKVVGALFN